MLEFSDFDEELALLGVRVEVVALFGEVFGDGVLQDCFSVFGVGSRTRDYQVDRVVAIVLFRFCLN